MMNLWILACLQALSGSGKKRDEKNTSNPYDSLISKLNAMDGSIKSVPGFITLMNNLMGG